MTVNPTGPSSADEASTSDGQNSPKSQHQPVRHKEGMELNNDHGLDDAASQQQQ